MRILTHTGCVDVTDDHSLILKSGEEISPKDIKIGTELLHNPLLEKVEQNIEQKFNKCKKYYNMVDAALYTNYLNSKNIGYYIEYNYELLNEIIIYKWNH